MKEGIIIIAIIYVYVYMYKIQPADPAAPVYISRRHTNSGFCEYLSKMDG
jgi:hypothetical protein